MMKKAAILLCALATLTAPLSAGEEPLPFDLPTPEGWRTETLPFPLTFAPGLPYAGLEELRFSPGMFEAGSDEFWSYAFVWWVKPEDPNDPEALSEHLETYFRGLADTVAESRGFEVGNATFAASIGAGENGEFSGFADAFDAFVTRGSVRLNIRGEVLPCPAQERQAILFALSPQKTDHTVWRRLDSIRDGFQCVAESEEP